jgi:hypothetical protein
MKLSNSSYVLRKIHTLTNYQFENVMVLPVFLGGSLFMRLPAINTLGINPLKTKANLFQKTAFLMQRFLY